MRFSKFLTDLLPRTGRIIKEDGDTFNEADMMYQDQKYSPVYQSVVNGAGVLSARFTVPGQSTYYLALDVPEGRAFVLFDRFLRTQAGLFNVDVVDGADTGGGTTVGTAKKTLRQDANPTIQTNLLLNANAPTSQEVTEYGFIDTGAAQTGQARAQGSSGAEGVFKIFTRKTWLKINKTNADPAICNIVLVGWELDVVDI